MSGNSTNLTYNKTFKWAGYVQTRPCIKTGDTWESQKYQKRVKNTSSLLFIVMQQQSNKLELFIERLCLTTNTIGFEQQGHVFLCIRCTFKQNKLLLCNQNTFKTRYFSNLI